MYIKIEENKIPPFIKEAFLKIKNAGFEVYIVGGPVRDILLEKEVKDWDLTTNAKPEEIMNLFSDCVYENDFGTVGVKVKEGDKTVDVIEITTYRTETIYSDGRHPDKVEFALTLKEDLSRRDFTVNALAIDLCGKPGETEVIDCFGGVKDVENKVIKAVGDPSTRFNEDALRLLRAIRFAVSLGFEIEKETWKAIVLNSKKIKLIAWERIKDEFEKIVLSENPARGVELLVSSGLMQYIIPEVVKTVGVTQNRHHYHGPYNTVYKHLIASLEKCPSTKLEVRLACLLHDIGKPGTKKGSGIDATFHNHEYLGGKLVEKILNRLKFPRKVVEKTVLLVRNHMFYYNVEEVGEAGVRRVIKKVGLENIKDLIDVRIGDRLGSGVAKAVPYKLRHFQFMVDKVSQDAVTVKQLKINGNDLIKKLKMKPSPQIGAILETLLLEVIENPLLNNEEYLIEKASILKDQNLSEIRILAKKRIKTENQKKVDNLKGKHWVK